jgi:hypothetical protein
MSVRISITAGGIYDATGSEIPVGTELTVKAEPKGWAGRYTVLSDSKGKTAVTNDSAPAGPFTVNDGGKGWWDILDAKGEKVGKSVREDDAKAFDTMSDEEKAAFAAEHAKAAFDADQKKA